MSEVTIECSDLERVSTCSDDELGLDKFSVLFALKVSDLKVEDKLWSLEKVEEVVEADENYRRKKKKKYDK